MAYDRFKMEEQLMKVWSMMDQLDTIAEGVLEYEWSEDDVANAVVGLKTMLNLEMEKTFNMFEQSVRNYEPD